MFDARDTLDSARVVLVNQELVRRYFSGGAVVGKTLGNVGRTPPTIVGVVGRRQSHAGRSGRRAGDLHRALAVAGYRTRLAVRTEGNPQAMLPMIRRVVASIDPDLPVFDVKPLDEIAADAVATERFALLLFGLFAALALGLSVVGIYGVLAYTVAQRLPEFGVRVALGARPAQLLEMVLTQGARLAAVGIVLGAAASILAARWIRGLLFGVQPFDPATLGAVAVLFGARRARRLPRARPPRGTGRSSDGNPQRLIERAIGRWAPTARRPLATYGRRTRRSVEQRVEHQLERPVRLIAMLRAESDQHHLAVAVLDATAAAFFAITCSPSSQPLCRMSRST